MKRLLLSGFLLFTTILMYAQTLGAPYNWGFQIGGTGATSGTFPGENTVVAVENDASDNTFALMIYRGTVTFGGTNYTAPGTSSSALPYGVILVKYNQTGIFQWAVPLSDANSKFIRPNKLTVDHAGNAIVAGEYLPYGTAATAELDFGEGKTVTRAYQAVIAKYDPAGVCQFVKPFEITATGRPTYLVTMLGCDASNNIYFADNQQGGLIDEGSKIRKLDANGDLIWMVENEKSVQCQGGSVDPNGNMMLAFGLGTSSAQPVQYRIGTVNFPISYFGSGVTACFDNTGAVKWTKIFKDTGAAAPILDDNGNGYFIHSSNASAANSPYGLLSNPNNGDFPVVKIDANGNLLKVKYRSYKNFNTAKLLNVNKTTGEVFMLGNYSAFSNSAITHGDNVFSGVNNKGYIPVLKYDTNLNEQGAFFGILCSSPVTNFLTSTVSNTGNIIVSGQIPGVATGTTTLGAATFTATKSKDAFITSLMPSAITIPAFTTWLGITTDWENAANWDNGIPTGSIKALIPGGLTKYPATFPATPTAGVFEVAIGATVNLPSNFTVSGIVKNNGAIGFSPVGTFAGPGADIEGTGTITINGSGNLNWTMNNIIKQKLIFSTTGTITLVGASITANEVQLGGKIITGFAQVKILSDAPNALSGYSDTKYISGNLVRATATTGLYAFPIGSSSFYQPGSISFNGNTTVKNITASFSPGNPTPAPTAACTVYGVPITAFVSGTNLGIWTFTADIAMSAGTYDIELQGTNGAFASEAANRIAIIKRANASSPWMGEGNWNVTTKGAAYPQYITAKITGLSSFSQFALGLASGNIPDVLPVKLTRFTAKATYNTALLNWETVSELNNDKFIIERSTDGKIFNQIGEVKGKGTVTLSSAYNFRDYTPVSDYNYYRLKQVDFDGKFEYSKIEAVKFALSNLNVAIKIYPNPIASNFSVSGNNSPVTAVNIVDLSGKKAFSLEHPTGEIALPAAIADGIYILNVNYGDGSVSKHKIVINKNK